MINKLIDYVKKKIKNVTVDDSVTTNSVYLTIGNSTKVRISDHFGNKIYALNIVVPETEGYFVVNMGYKVHIYKSTREVGDIIVTYLRMEDGLDSKLQNQSRQISTLERQNFELNQSNNNLKHELDKAKILIGQLQTLNKNLSTEKENSGSLKDKIKNQAAVITDLQNKTEEYKEEIRNKTDALKEAIDIIENLSTSEELREMMYDRTAGKKYYLDNFSPEVQDIVLDLIKNYYR